MKLKKKRKKISLLTIIIFLGIALSQSQNICACEEERVSSNLEKDIRQQMRNMGLLPFKRTPESFHLPSKEIIRKRMQEIELQFEKKEDKDKFIKEMCSSAGQPIDGPGIVTHLFKICEKYSRNSVQVIPQLIVALSNDNPTLCIPAITFYYDILTSIKNLSELNFRE